MERGSTREEEKAKVEEGEDTYFCSSEDRKCKSFLIHFFFPSFIPLELMIRTMI